MPRTRPAPHLLRRSPAAAAALAALCFAACLGSVNRVYDDGGTGAPSDGSVAPETASGSDDGSGGDGSSSGAASDASNDVGPDVAKSEVGSPETGPAPDAATEAATGQTYACNGTQISSCAACSSGTIDCVFCMGPGGDPHPGVCGTKGQYCQSVAPAPASVCTCPGNNVSACPTPFQVCAFAVGQYYCQTCGETGSNGHLCRGGGTCNEQTGTCS
jgi:hypothetical protein